ncbi:MAG: alpha/beta fold hydrolase [Steroidobacter sp.]
MTDLDPLQRLSTVVRYRQRQRESNVGSKPPAHGAVKLMHRHSFRVARCVFKEISLALSPWAELIRLSDIDWMRRLAHITKPPDDITRDKDARQRRVMIEVRNAVRDFTSTYDSHAGNIRHMKTIALILTFLVSAAVSAQEPTTGYAPVNGLKMYYEIHGKGEPVVLLHGSFMTITNNWTGAIAQLSKSRQVIAVEMQAHGRTADINRDFSYEHLADDIAALLDFLKIKQADVLGYSMGGGVAMQVAIRHPEKVRKVVSISSVFRHDGWVKEAVDAYPQIEPGMFKGSPIEAEYKKLSPTPDRFDTFVKRVIQMDIKPYDFGAEKLAATTMPILFIHGDADGVRLDHIAEMFRLKGGDIMGDMRPRSESRLAVLPNTTHVTLMDKWDVIVPMVNDFLGAQPQKQ